MKNIVILGAGGMGREVFGYVKDCINAGAVWSIKGFIDDNLDALKNYKNYAPILSTISSYVPLENDAVIVAIADPQIKKNCVEILQKKGAKFEKLIHPTCTIGENVEIGEGVVMAAYSGATCDVKIGNFCFLNRHASLGHDSSIGDFTSLSSYCDVTGFASLGECAFMSSHATIAPRVKVGNNVKVGINSAVISNVKDGASVFGTPAQKINF